MVLKIDDPESREDRGTSPPHHGPSAAVIPPRSRSSRDVLLRAHPRRDIWCGECSTGKALRASWCLQCLPSYLSSSVHPRTIALAIDPLSVFSCTAGVGAGAGTTLSSIITVEHGSLLQRRCSRRMAYASRHIISSITSLKWPCDLETCERGVCVFDPCTFHAIN